MLEVLRIGHRPDRDKRMTTHVCLTARALGADRVLVDTADRDLERRLARVSESFGGAFEVKTGVKWRPLLKGTDATVVHLTMYGENVAAWEGPRWETLRTAPHVIAVVGSTKVPGELFELADINAAVGNQPHSEVAALAIFLYLLQGGDPLLRKMAGGRLQIVPQERGKQVLDLGGLGEETPDGLGLEL